MWAYPSIAERFSEFHETVNPFAVFVWHKSVPFTVHASACNRRSPILMCINYHQKDALLAMDERVCIARALRARVPTSDDLWKPISWPVSNHIRNLDIIDPAVPEIQKVGMHVRTCARAPHPVRGNPLADWFSTKHKIWAQTAQPFLRYRNRVSTCARAHVPPPSSWEHLSW